MKALDSLFSHATIEIAQSLMPQGWIACNDAPNTLESLTLAYQHTGGRLVVSDWHGPESIFINPWEQIAFQAWHDYNHVMLQGSFDPAGERRVHAAQVSQLAAWADRQPVTSREFGRMVSILRAHNIGRLDYWTFNGDAPENFRAFASGVLFADGVL